MPPLPSIGGLDGSGDRDASRFFEAIALRPVLDLGVESDRECVRTRRYGSHVTLVECMHDREAADAITCAMEECGALVVRLHEWSSMAARLWPLRREIVVPHRTLVLVDAHLLGMRPTTLFELYELLIRATQVQHVLLVVPASVDEPLAALLAASGETTDAAVPMSLPSLLPPRQPFPKSRLGTMPTTSAAAFARFEQCLRRHERVPAFLFSDEIFGTSPLVLCDPHGRGALSHLVASLCSRGRAAGSPLLYQFFACSPNARRALADALDAECFGAGTWRQGKRRCPHRGDPLVVVDSVTANGNGNGDGNVDANDVQVARLDGFVCALPRDEVRALECTDVDEPTRYAGPPVETALVRVDADTTPADLWRALAAARTRLVVLASRREWARWCARQME